VARYDLTSARDFVVGDGNNDVGNKTLTRKPGQPGTKRLAGANGLAAPRIGIPNLEKTERPKICGAMSQQRCDSGIQSAPQKFVQLVGCRDPKVQPKPWVRPAPVKR
jgi:hypothetical protein